MRCVDFFMWQICNILIVRILDMQIERYKSPIGRIGRIEFFLWFALPALFIMVFANILKGVSGSNAPVFICGVAMLYPYFCGIIKRLHDFSVPGWVAILNIIPGINLLFSLALVLVPGSKSSNKYGAPNV